MGRNSVLVVDDDPDIRSVLRDSLEFDGFEVYEADGQEKLLNVLSDKSVDVVLLDLVLNNSSGLDLISDIKTYTEAPIIVVSGKSQSIDRVLSLEMGADDYLCKPIDIHELCARIRANLRRYHRAAKSEDNTLKKLQFEHWTMDCAKYQIFDQDGKCGDLTTMEYKLLEILIKAQGRALSREQLFELARLNNDEAYDRAIDVQITRIRKKIGDDAKKPRMIKTVRGIGYMFDGKVQTLN